VQITENNANIALRMSDPIVKIGLDSKRSPQGSPMSLGEKLRKLVWALAFSVTFGGAFFASAPVQADYQTGVDDYHRSDFQGAYNEWLPLAQSGDAESQNALGALYDHGLGIAQDHVKAAYWYEKAAKQNFPLAMRNLGTLYANGHGVPLDLDQAKSWLKKAADLGDEESARRLAALNGTAASASSNATADNTGTAPSEAEPPSTENSSTETPAPGAASSAPAADIPDTSSSDTGGSAPSAPAAGGFMAGGSMASAAPEPQASTANTNSAPPADAAAPQAAPAPAPVAPPPTASPPTTFPTTTPTVSAVTPEGGQPAAQPADTDATAPAKNGSTSDQSGGLPPPSGVPAPESAPSVAPAAANSSAGESPASGSASDAGQIADVPVAIDENAASAAPVATNESGLPKSTPAQPESSDSKAKPLSPRKPSTKAETSKAETAPPPKMTEMGAAPKAIAAEELPVTTPASSAAAETAETEKPAPAEAAPKASAPATTTPTASAQPPVAAPVSVASVSATPVPAANEVAAVAPPAPENWLLGKWQGPAYGCPPGGGIEFAADHSFTYFKGKITVRLPVSYRVDPGSVTVTTVGSDGIAQDYVYQQTGPDSMIIVGIPPNMPRSLLGAAHRRCDAPAAAKTQQASIQAPAAIYPGAETNLSRATLPVTTPSTNYAGTPQPAAPSARMAPLPPAPASETPPAESQSAPPPAAEPVSPKAETPPASVTSASETTESPKLPKSTTPASVADAAKKAEKSSTAAVAPAATAAVAPIAAEMPASQPAEANAAPAGEQQASATPPAPADTTASAEQKGWDALNAGHQDEALEIWEPLAKAGDTGLAVNVAGMYEFGQKLPQDYAKSTAWYQIAAEQGDGYAQYKVGRAYTRGTGVEIDRVQAYKWLTLAMQSLSNESDKSKTGKASKLEIETALNDIVGAMSQSDMAKAAQLVKDYDSRHKTATP
jgi:TPR repeat protein